MKSLKQNLKIVPLEILRIRNNNESIRWLWEEGIRSNINTAYLKNDINIPLETLNEMFIRSIETNAKCDLIQLTKEQSILHNKMKDFFSYFHNEFEEWKVQKNI